MTSIWNWIKKAAPTGVIFVLATFVTVFFGRILFGHPENLNETLSVLRTAAEIGIALAMTNIVLICWKKRNMLSEETIESSRWMAIIKTLLFTAAFIVFYVIFDFIISRFF